MFFYEVIRGTGNYLQLPDVGTYEHHRFICDLFQHKKGIRDLLFVVYSNKYYVVSDNLPQNFDPKIVHIRSKSYQPVVEKGCPLRFDVRLTAEPRVKNVRTSLVPAYKEKLGKNHSLRRDTLMHDAAVDWFSKHSMKYGFKVRDLFIQGFHKYKFKKSDGSPVDFDSLDIRGVLEVSSPAVFVSTLYRGIGKARAYGCGLMLVSR